MLIRDVRITPVAFRDPPLLNAIGVHEPLVLRCIVRLVLDDGVVGLGECAGQRPQLDRLAAVRPHLIGMSVFDTNGIERTIGTVLRAGTPPGGTPDPMGARNAFSVIETACMDAQGRLTGRSVSELLGGAVRATVPFSAYLFYKWAEHPPLDGRPAIPDEWGAALDPAGVVDQAKAMIEEYGFRSIKLKGGVFPPDEEIAAVRALRAAFPDHPLRIDPNCAWTVETARRVAAELDGVLEYLEDPVPGIAGMARVAATAPMPLATNMCVVAPEHLPPAIAQDAVQVLLTDHHYWGGLRRTGELARLCATFGIGVSMHSNSHLGVSLAAMTHVAAATPELTYACDTHYPWNRRDDVVRPGVLRFADGGVPVPEGPGLGVELDDEVLDRLHRAYLAARREARDDTGYMRRFDPAFDPSPARW
ncbi:glucarate dehydratase [Murinocardiopsis flavida]|uniref:glucarate dehydratase n=1 Tax=Murinocardiopsis flavida TaxID=645275 RepID=A0A2P8DKS1_9ACTN|nr:glucarate dehydratase family protein [Murinocardiopsis flavida]PSK97799.1 glucarate dehydratase [Murinocardiopsis flavida]